MRKYIPNALTLSRVVLIVPLVILTASQNYAWAAVCYGVGLATNCLDGFYARHWDACSEVGRDFLQPICDLLYAGAAVALLIYNSHWSIWVGVIIAAIAGILQAISVLAERKPHHRMIRTLKRHQGYLHPFYSVIVMIVAWWMYVHLAASEESYPVAALLYLLFGCGLVFGVAVSYPYVHQMVKKSLAFAQFSSTK